MDTQQYIAEEIERERLLRSQQYASQCQTLNDLAMAQSMALAMAIGNSVPEHIVLRAKVRELQDQMKTAVQAERARCAKIAREIAEDPHGSNPACAAAEEIAAKIEAGE